jgi:adenylylsulfate kinase-like enzyme
VWITGRPGSGKTTLARAVFEVLGRRSAGIRLLTARDVWREVRPDALGAAGAQDMIHRILACAAGVLTEAGIAVLVDAGAPRRAWRDLARALVARFAEVQLLCPPEICRERERAARWDLRFARPSHAERPAKPGGIEDLFEFEVSRHAELVLHTHLQGVWTTAEEVLTLIRRLSAGRAAPIHHAERRQSCE